MKQKLLAWRGDSRNALRKFPQEVKKIIGTALYYAQLGLRHPSAKPLSGFNGSKTIEVIEDFDRNTYRAVYTVKITGIIYVQYMFQEKSKSGAKTPRPKIVSLIEGRKTC
jgi:phage-related protein